MLGGEEGGGLRVLNGPGGARNLGVSANKPVAQDAATAVIADGDCADLALVVLGLVEL